jgi:predicted kinase
VSGHLVITRGLPASGKTTWAKAWLARTEEGGPDRMRCNRDDLRESWFAGAGVLDHSAEKAITAAQHATVRAWLRVGGHAVVDDMNLRLRYARAWADVAAPEGATFQVVDFGLPLAELLQRDAARIEAGERGVGERVLMDLHARFPHPWPTVAPTAGASGISDLYVPRTNLPPAWLVDVDGTLADNAARDPFAWDRVGEDSPIEAVITLVQALARTADVVVVSGRDGSCWDATAAWLKRHEVPFTALHMRPPGDMRKDAVVKRELFDTHIAPLWNVRGVIDDRRQVVDMWRAMGLMCAQVAPGDF